MTQDVCVCFFQTKIDRSLVIPIIFEAVLGCENNDVKKLNGC